jgi:hypothetical protein
LPSGTGIGFFDNILAKYVATMVGFFLVSRPFFDTTNEFMNARSKDELIQVQDSGWPDRGRAGLLRQRTHDGAIGPRIWSHCTGWS